MIIRHFGRRWIAVSYTHLDVYKRQEENLDKFLKLVDDKHNGITLCTGSLGCSAKNDVPRLAAKYAAMGRLHFAHLRNVAVLDNGFEERAHLSSCGSLDMFAIVKALVENGFDGYVRPDHGRMIWGETGRAGYGLYDRALAVSYTHLLCSPFLEIFGSQSGLPGNQLSWGSSGQNSQMLQKNFQPHENQDHAACDLCPRIIPASEDIPHLNADHGQKEGDNSDTGHGWDNAVSYTHLDVYKRQIQLGAILAVAFMYFDRLNTFGRRKSARQREATWILWIKVIIACIPAAVLGLLLDDWMDAHLYNAYVVAFTLILYGVLFIAL